MGVAPAKIISVVILLFEVALVTLVTLVSLPNIIIATKNKQTSVRKIYNFKRIIGI